LRLANSRWGRFASVLAIAAIAVASAPGIATALVEKPFRKPVIKEPPKTEKVDVNATRITYDPDTGIAVATGDVHLAYGPYRLTATKVTYNKRTNVLTANGSVTLREPNGNIAQATTLQTNTAFSEGFARHLTALLTNDVTITAEYATRSEGRITVFEKATYTACKNCQTRSGKPLWQLVTDKTVHDQQKHTLAHTNPKLQISGVTVGALPYLVLPDPSVKRRTGFLVPAYKVNDYAGFGVITPFFWAPAPNYDVTLRPWFTLSQGPVADVEWRHRLVSGRYKVRGYGVRQWDPQETGGDANRWRGALTTDGRFALNRDWDWGWQGTAVSDRSFLRRYGYDSRNIGTNETYLTGLWDQTFINAGALNYTSMSGAIENQDLPEALPYFSVDHSFADPFLGGTLNLNLDGYSLWRDRASTPFETVNHGTEQTRLVSQLSWRKESTLDGGQLLTTFARLRDDVFLTNNLPDATLAGGKQDREMQHRILPSAGFDVRWPFVASTDWGSNIVTPVAQLIATRDETDRDSVGNEDAITLNFDHSSLFLEDRFTGLDRYEGGIRANLGLTYNMLLNGGSFVRASVGESFHLAGENSFDLGSGLDGPKSDIVAALAVSPFSGVSLSYEGRFEEDLSAINRQEAKLGLSFDRFSGNAGYLFIDAEPAYGRKVTEEFASANARVFMGRGWYVTGNMNFDLQKDYFRSRGLGLEFDCQCMNAKFAYSQVKTSINSDIDHRLLLSVNFATLGGTSFSSRY
jgi:LPS-assembly protein